MSKSKMSVREWLSTRFKNSFKTLSETLSTDQFNQFVQDAEALQESETSDSETTEGSETTNSEVEGAEDPVNSDPAAPGAENTDLQSQVSALTTKLEAANTALAAEKKAHETTAAELTSSQSAVTAAEAKYSKLRQAVNPMSDEDLANKDNNEQQNAGLTKTDIEARAAYSKNHPQA